jgi:hypothetical protein
MLTKKKKPRRNLGKKKLRSHVCTFVNGGKGALPEEISFSEFQIFA